MFKISEIRGYTAMRRQFLIFTLSLSGFLISCNTWGPIKNILQENMTQPVRSRLVFPPQQSVTNAVLSPQEVEVRLGNTSIKGMGYHQGLLGPTLIANAGEQAQIKVQNQLKEPTNVHWHGLVVPADQDGHPEQLIAPSASQTYLFQIKQAGGLYWYHPHPHNLTAKQAYLGLAGLFVVRDPLEAKLNLPVDSQEAFLVLQDKRLENNALDYKPNQQDIMSGYLGQDILVNGQKNTQMQVFQGIYRLRILNGSNARVYNIAFDKETPFWIIGGDGGLTETPYPSKAVLLGPGERLDLLADFSSHEAGSSLKLISQPFKGVKTQGQQAFSLLDIQIEKGPIKPYLIPNQLATLEKIQTPQGTKTRSFELQGMKMSGVDAMPEMGHGSMMMPTGGNTIMRGMHTINGKTFDMKRIDETVPAGASEIWVFDNSKGDEIHPMHLHGAQFQIIQREGGRNSVFSHEKTRKDTVLLMPGEKVSIAVKFPDYKGKYVIHCHNLEHEDDGMMLNFELI
ncbi:MAG: multicopper oxidase domain-containing protein [Candidatus Sericytochromatia bacterium]|nr:multicopper oxidase domain-containing protein [Candidatus Sericytochromatia bacterium]